MAVRPGTLLGAYEVLSLLGSGGMGEVYRATDTKLGRDVALKLLPPAFVGDPDRLARFRREAHVLAALNHPNIAAIYGLDDADDRQFLVLELVEGESLDKRITRGRIAVDEALAIATQIAEALEAAHDKGIIHRDLKPANIAVAKDGNVKVLDFGLAKATEHAGSASLDLINSPTITSPAMMTGVGVILGTAAYMSPEQARGRLVDKRSDVWAFACLVYEMLAGRRAFGGEDVTDTIGAVIAGEPDWSLLPATTHPRLKPVLQRCLKKDARDRFRDIADVRYALLDAVSPQDGVAPVAVAPRFSILRLSVSAAVGVLAGAAITAVVFQRSLEQRRDASPHTGAIRLSAVLPTGARLAGAEDFPLSLGRPSIAMAPDGTRIAFVAVQDGIASIFVRSLRDGTVKPVPRTEGAMSPFFSPDGEWLAYFVDVQLRKVSLLGGEPIVVCDARNPYGGTWASDDTIVFSDGEGERLVRVAATGGVPRSLTSASGPNSHMWPELLPGEQSALVTRIVGAFGTDDYRVMLVSLGTGQARELVAGNSARYITPGYLVFTRGSTLMAASFDPVRAVVGAAVPLIDHIVRNDQAAQFASAASGSVVYATGIDSGPRSLVWVDRRGSATPMSVARRPYGTFRLSPDGHRLAFQTLGATSDVWVYDIDRASSTRLTTTGNNGQPIWTSDGASITYGADHGDKLQILSQPYSAAGKPTRLDAGPGDMPDDWSPDGRILAINRSGADTGSDIWLLSMADHSVRPFVQTPFEEWGLRFSPDGHYAAYVSDESGRYEVYVRPTTGSGEKFQVSSDGGEEPLWNPNGREMIYRNGRKWMSVTTETRQQFHADAPRELFSGSYLNVFGHSYDIAHDGSRFLLLTQDERPPSTALEVIVNWSEELKTRVPRK